jgi:hypothetical protein
MLENQKYPDYVGVSEVSTRSFEHMRVEAYFAGQPSLMFDEPEGFDIGDPPELRGRSRGWTPVHAQLAALAGCTAITIAVVARDQQFKYEGPCRQYAGGKADHPTALGGQIALAPRGVANQRGAALLLPSGQPGQSPTAGRRDLRSAALKASS